MATAALTGTATTGITEADVVTGGKIITITLTGDTWISAGALFSDGFESNNFTAWTGEDDSDNNLSVQGTTKRTGSYAAMDTIDTNTPAYIYKDITNVTELWTQFYVRVNSITSNVSSNWGTHTIYQVTPNGGGTAYQVIKLQLNGASPSLIGYLRAEYRDGSDVSQDFGPAITIAADTWYRVKTQYKKGGSGTGILKVWWGTSETPIIEQTALTMSSSTNFGRLMLGDQSGGFASLTWITCVMYFDDFEVAETNIW